MKALQFVQQSESDYRRTVGAARKLPLDVKVPALEKLHLLRHRQEGPILHLLSP